MLRDYEVELLEEMVKEDKYKNNIPLATCFVVDLLDAYKQANNHVEQLEEENKFQIETIYSFFELIEIKPHKCPLSSFGFETDKCERCREGDRSYMGCWKEACSKMKVRDNKKGE